MHLHFYDLEALEEEVKALPPLHRVAFVASICERMLPNYNAFSRTETLEHNVVEWLRTSFDNDGKSIIDVS
ncbi:MAG TPA: DUF416 family protein [Coleofasciculaceae cyanobacterium]